MGRDRSRDRGASRPLLPGGTVKSKNGNRNSFSRHHDKNNGNAKRKPARYSGSKDVGGTSNKARNHIISQPRASNDMTSTEDDDNFDEVDEDENFDEINEKGDKISGHSASSSNGWCSGFTSTPRKIGLLVWKNLLMRKRHYIVTALEIILPTLLTVTVAYAQAKSNVGSGQSIDINHTEFHEFEEEDLVTALQWQVSCENCIIAYTPKNSETDQVIEELKNALLGSAIEWRGLKDEHEIEELLARMSFNETHDLRGAIVFEDGLQNGDAASYKIRMRDSITNTGLLFPIIQIPGPIRANADFYAESGFIGFQVLLDRILVNRFTGKNFPQEISLQAFPYPPFTFSIDLNFLYFYLLPIVFVFAFIFMVPSIVRVVVSEKESGIKELLKMNGVPGWMQWLGWMINSLLILSISISIVVFLLFWKFKTESGGDGSVVQYGDPAVWWVVLFLYAMASSAFCFFISSFFSRPALATTVGLILYLVSYFFPLTRVEESYQFFTLVEKLGVCLLPNMALHMAIRVMMSLEGKAVGAHWMNVLQPISSVDELSLGYVICMFLADTVLYMFLTVYVENVLPSTYGVRKPWYYILKPSTWCPTRVAQGNEVQVDVPLDYENNMSGFEAGPDAVVGVDIKNLRKEFGKHKVAVAGVSVKMYAGEIFALLGHNGAGKTTVISMLTGLFAPSGGTATVNGYDITTNLDGVRNNLGLCPQHNMLFDKLTVSEHLRFFGQLKGLSASQATKEMKELLQKLQLSEKETILSMNLSGGQKRKLSLGIALIGGTKVVILDEPTSGMDPEARRAIWDLLLEMRGERTICLTTHFMEEADVLGDRIGIMAGGKMQCCGTAMFLKKFYGAGYTLKFSVSQSAEQNVILRFIQKYIPNASVKSSHSANTSEMLITLPTETATTAALSTLSSELMKNKKQLGIKTIGLSLTTMDEVFLRVGELVDEHDAIAKENSSVQGTPDFHQEVVDEKMSLKSEHERSRGLKLVGEQFMALFVKKYTYALRKLRLLISQLIIPIVLLVLAIKASNASFEVEHPPPPLTLTLDSYREPVTLYSALDSLFSPYLSSVAGSSAKKIPDGTSLGDYITQLAVSDLASYRERHIIAAEFNRTNFKAMFNTIPTHAAPLAINLATNTLLKSLSPSSNYKIRVTNHPLQSRMAALLGSADPNPMYTQTVPIMFAVFLPIGLALLAASFIVFPVEERLCKAKQVQMMTGVSPLTYWSSSFAWDFFIVLLVVCAMTACFPIFENYSVFTSYGGYAVVFTILLIYGYSAITFSYIVSLSSQTVAGGFAFVSILHVLSGMILCLVVHIAETMAVANVATYARWVGRIFPTFGAAISTMRFSEIATTNGRCNILSAEVKTLICDPHIISVPTKHRDCCENCAGFGAKCFAPIPYLTWEYDKTPMLDGPPSASNVSISKVPGIGQELMYMALMAQIYQILLILLEYQIVQRIIAKIIRTNESVFQATINDEDVLAESQRVSDLVSNGNVYDEAVVIDNFCKSYGSFAAVSKLSFGVHHGECFGLLGVNGAGKTTTFRMLTGDEFRSYGNAYGFMSSLERDRKEFTGNIGYCPQFDAIIGVMTGREMLKLFCRLRGVPGKYGKAEAEKWLTKLGLIESANVQCQKYSGGMKRRLSVAMAMIGDPPLLLLDEPTSGVDPVSRHQFWGVLNSVRNSGQSIILTSHSMDECEALCSRLGIMVNGQLQCLGGVQHLKNKFAQGYSISLKLKAMIPAESAELNSLTADVQNRLQPCTLKDKHQNILQYQVHNTAIAWDVLFRTMEDLKAQYSDIIEDYSVNETSLEEIFLSFARKQYGKRTADVSFLKKIITCQLC